VSVKRGKVPNKFKHRCVFCNQEAIGDSPVCKEHLDQNLLCFGHLVRAGWSYCPICGAKTNLKKGTTSNFELKGFLHDIVRCKKCSAEWKIEIPLPDLLSKRVITAELRKPALNQKGSDLVGIKKGLDWWKKLTDNQKRKSKCPYCGKTFSTQPMPKYCPHCKGEFVVPPQAPAKVEKPQRGLFEKSPNEWTAQEWCCILVIIFIILSIIYSYLEYQSLVGFSESW